MTYAAKKKRRPRFSLLNLVMMMTIAAMGLSMWRVRVQFEPLRAQIDNLNFELGRVSISDPQRMHYRVAPASRDSFRHVRMRVYVPRGKSATARMMVYQHQPDRSSTGRGGSFMLPAGEHSLDLEVFREPVGDKWRYLLTSLSPRVGGVERDGPLPPWFKEDGTWDGMIYNDGRPQGIASGEAHEVVRRQATRKDGSSVEVLLSLTLSE